MKNSTYPNELPTSMNKTFQILLKDLQTKTKTEIDNQFEILLLKKQIIELQKTITELKFKLQHYETQFHNFNLENDKFISTINSVTFKSNTSRLNPTKPTHFKSLTSINYPPHLFSLNKTLTLNK